MDLGKAFHVETIAERAFQHRLNLPVPAHGGGWIISFKEHPDVVILDPKLKQAKRLDLPAQSKRNRPTAVAMSQNGRLLALSGRNDLRIVSHRGKLLHCISHPAWSPYAEGSCFFDSKDRIWYVRPGTEPGINDQVTIVNPKSGETISEQMMPNEVGIFRLYPCLRGQAALIDVGCGQDGIFLYLARIVGARMTIKQYPFTDRTFGSFSPNQREFVTGAQWGDAIKIHSFPSGRVIASVKSKAIFAKDDFVGEYPDDLRYQAIFLDRSRLLAYTRFGRLLLINRRTMQLMGTVWPEGYRLRAYDENGKVTNDPSKTVDYEGDLTSFHSAGLGRVLAVYDEKALQLLDVSGLLSPSKKPR